MDDFLNEGPDQIIPTSNLTTTEPDGVVGLRSIETKASAMVPESIPGLLARTAAQYPNHPALCYKNDPGENGFHSITYRQYRNQVRKVAKAFIKLGLERYHSVAIIGFNSPEWFISYLAAIHAGGIATGIYITNSPEAICYCLENSRANIVVAGDQTLVDKILKYRKDLPELKKIIQYEGTPIVDDVLSWKDVLDIGHAEANTALENILKKITINQCASIVYTSGTVGNPKPAMISHDNLTFEGKVGVNAIGMTHGQSSVSYLPLSHIAAQTIDIFMPLEVGGTVYFADKDALKGSLPKTLLEVRPTFFFGVPRVFEKMAEKMREIGARAGLITKMIATWAKNQGLRRHTDLMKGFDNPGLRYLLARAIIFSRVKQNLGFDRVKWLYSGGAPLSTDIKMYFASLDLPIMEVYGVTECTGAQTLGIPTAFHFESIGRTIPGVKTKIHAPDQDKQGEICIYGRNVFMGYLNDRAKTDEAIDKEGWLHTGDIGRIIEKSEFVYITGRQKEIIITAGGENIPPALVEEKIKTELPCLGYAVLIGDKRKYLTVLLTLSCEVNADTGEASEQLSEVTKHWLKDLGCQFNTIKEVIASGPDEKIVKAIQSGIDASNEKAISNAQKVQKFVLLPHDFSISTGELGPTLKLRRNVVNTKYKDIIDQLY